MLKLTLIEEKKVIIKENNCFLTFLTTVITFSLWGSDARASNYRNHYNCEQKQIRRQGIMSSFMLLLLMNKFTEEINTFSLQNMVSFHRLIH